MPKRSTSQSEPDRNTFRSGSHAKKDKKRTITKYQCYRWQFTYNLQSEPEKPEIHEFWKILKEYGKEFYFQLEQGETGNWHYQGCISLKQKEYFGTVKNIFGDETIHIDDAKKWFALKQYCQKKDTRKAGPWSNKSIWIDTIEKLRPWQAWTLETIINKPVDPRSIYWIWDKGGNGKSEFAKWLYVNKNAVVLDNATCRDIAFAIPEDPKLIVFDLQKDQGNKVNFTALESIKNGMIFSSKYESCSKVFNRPHVFVFANQAPDTTHMTIDKWKIIELPDSEIIQKVTEVSYTKFDNSMYNSQTKIEDHFQSRVPGTGQSQVPLAELSPHKCSSSDVPPDSSRSIWAPDSDSESALTSTSLAAESAASRTSSSSKSPFRKKTSSSELQQSTGFPQTVTDSSQGTGYCPSQLTCAQDCPGDYNQTLISIPITSGDG